MPQRVLLNAKIGRHPRPWLNAGAFERGPDPVSVVESHEDQEMLGQTLVVAVLILFPGFFAKADGPPLPTRTPRVRVVDLDMNESVEVDLGDGTKARVKLLAIDEVRDSIRDAVRERR